MKSKKTGIIVLIIVAAAILSTAIVVILGGNGRKLKKQLDLGQKYLSEMNYEEAIATFEKALEIDPMSAEAYLGMADAYVGMGDLGSAKATLEKGIEILSGAGKDTSALEAKLKEVQDEIARIEAEEEARKKAEEEEAVQLQEEEVEIQYDFSFEDFKFDGISVDFGFIDKIIEAENITGKYTDYCDISPNGLYVARNNKQDDQRDIDINNPDGDSNSLAVERSGIAELDFHTYEYCPDEVAAKFESPIPIGMSEEELRKLFHIDEMDISVYDEGHFKGETNSNLGLIEVSGNVLDSIDYIDSNLYFRQAELMDGLKWTLLVFLKDGKVIGWRLSKSNDEW